MSDFPHTATVQRTPGNVSGGAWVPGAVTTIYASMRCLFEPQREPWELPTELGPLTGRVYVLSWPDGEDLRNDDLVTLAHKSGKKYRFKLGADDTNRPAGLTSLFAYQTGKLYEEDLTRATS